jgi:hypothetical protein
MGWVAMGGHIFPRTGLAMGERLVMSWHGLCWPLARLDIGYAGHCLAVVVLSMR